MGKIMSSVTNLFSPGETRGRRMCLCFFSDEYSKSLHHKSPLSWMFSTLSCTFAGLWEARHPPLPPPLPFLPFPATATCLRPLVYAGVWKKTLPDFPAECLSRWLSIWSGWWNLVCARPLLGDVEVTMWQQGSERKSLNCKLWKWDYCRDPDSPPCFLLTAALCN